MNRKGVFLDDVDTKDEWRGWENLNKNSIANVSR